MLLFDVVKLCSPYDSQSFLSINVDSLELIKVVPWFWMETFLLSVEASQRYPSLHHIQVLVFLHYLSSGYHIYLTIWLDTSSYLLNFYVTNTALNMFTYLYTPDSFTKILLVSDCRPEALSYIFIVNHFNAQMNHMDLSPNYAGTLMGITSTCANAVSFFGPYFTGAMTKNNVRHQNWIFWS